MEIREEIGARVRAIRESKGIKRRPLELVAGLAKGGLDVVERGEVEPNGHDLQALAEALGVPFTALLAGEVIRVDVDPGRRRAAPINPGEAQRVVEDALREALRQRNPSKPCRGCGAPAGQPCGSAQESTSPLLERLAKIFHRVMADGDMVPEWSALPAIVRRRIRAGASTVVSELLDHIAGEVLTVDAQAEIPPGGVV